MLKQGSGCVLLDVDSGFVSEGPPPLDKQLVDEPPLVTLRHRHLVCYQLTCVTLRCLGPFGVSATTSSPMRAPDNAWKSGRPLRNSDESLDCFHDVRSVNTRRGELLGRRS